MIAATGATTCEQALEMTFNVFHTAGDLLKERGLFAGVADEGGYWPTFDRNEAVFGAMIEAIVRAGYDPGRQVAISLRDRDAGSDPGHATRRMAAGNLSALRRDDAFIAHLAVATNAGQLKVGSFCRSERMAKWNELLRIQRELGAGAQFTGSRIYRRILTAPNVII